MLVPEYSYEEDIMVKQEEARQEGLEQVKQSEREQMAVNALTATGSVK